MPSETERVRRLRVALIKTLTGDDTIRCRPIYGRPFTYRRTFKAVLITNHKPRVDDDTEAVWRRLRLVPFAVTIPKVERDTKLSEKLWAEAPGILAWLVRGCMAWQVDGLGEPDAVMDATSAYREESDPVSAFVADACTLTPDAWTLTADLRTAYERFCNEQGDHPVGSRRFTDAMTRAGCTPERRHAGRGWRGIGLLA